MLHKRSALGAPHHNSMQRNEKEEKISTNMEDLSPVTRWQFLYCGFLQHSGLFYTTPLFAELTSHFIWFAQCFITCEEAAFIYFLYCRIPYNLAAENGFSKNNVSVLHRLPGVCTTVLECVSHCLELHSPEQNTIQPLCLFSRQEVELRINVKLT